jgi:hypothetical protein
MAALQSRRGKLDCTAELTDVQAVYNASITEPGIRHSIAAGSNAASHAPCPDAALLI